MPYLNLKVESVIMNSACPRMDAREILRVNPCLILFLFFFTENFETRRFANIKV